MNTELLQLVFFAVLVRLFVIAAEPAAAPWPQQTWGKFCGSTGLAAAAAQRLLPECCAAAEERGPVVLAARSAGGAAPGRRTRRGGRRRRSRGRRGGRRHQRGGGGGGASSSAPAPGGGGSWGLCVLSLNIQSVKPKILSLRHDLSYLNCDICVLSETWLKPETLSRYVNFPGYSLTRADRRDGRGYGGLAVLSRVGFSVKRLQSVCTCNSCRLETLWMTVSCSRGRKFVLCAVYRPHVMPPTI